MPENLLGLATAFIISTRSPSRITLSASSRQRATERMSPSSPFILMFRTLDSVFLRVVKVRTSETEETVPVTTGIWPSSTSPASIVRTEIGVGCGVMTAVSCATYSTIPSSSFRTTPVMETDVPSSTSEKVSGDHVTSLVVPLSSPTSIS